MSTYTTTWTTWERVFSEAISSVQLNKLGVGLQCNTKTPLSEHDLEMRFQKLFESGIEEIDIWASPIPDYWWPWILRFALLP